MKPFWITQVDSSESTLGAPVTSILIRDREEKVMRRRRQKLVMQPQTKECLAPPEAGKGQGKESPLEPRREHGLADTLISDF